MTKDEFRAQFRRLVVAGYRLPADIPRDEVMNTWFETFASCRVEDLHAAITGLLKTKPDTFWPSIGEVYQGVSAQKTARARAHPTVDLTEPTQEQLDTALRFWREMKQKFGVHHPLADVADPNMFTKDAGDE